MVNKDFLKDVLAGKKELLKKDKVAFIQVPHYDELSVRKTNLAAETFEGPPPQRHSRVTGRDDVLSMVETEHA